IFDFLAESVMGGLGRAMATGAAPGYATDFVQHYLLPHLRTLLDRGVRVVANAGGLAPAACAAAMREGAEAQGLSPRIGVVEGDNLTARARELIDAGTRDMFDGEPLRPKVEQADRINSLVAYTGAFPIAAALSAGADIVITGRAVDSAMALGPLIHEFGWGPDDFDLLAAGTTAGHLLECSAQVTGGTFTDWRDVPDWAGIGMPIGECHADGRVVITKPEGTGGMVTIGTVAEQLLYEVSDPQRYYVADVVVDFTGIALDQVGKDRVEVSGARGLGRTSTCKASLTMESGWRGSALIPVIGLEAGAKARRIGEEIFARSNDLLRRAQLPPFTRTRCDVVGGEGPEAGPAICRLVADHPDRAGAELLVREQGSAISHMSVGITLGLGTEVRPIQSINGFLIPKSAVTQRVTLDGVELAFAPIRDGQEMPADPPSFPDVPDDADPALTVPLIRLAWARSGDKGNLFNVAVIAREPRFLPYIAAALSGDAVGAHYGRLLADGRPLPVECYSVPGLSAINFVVGSSMDGGIMASTTLDPVAKGMAQLLLGRPIPVSPAIHDALMAEASAA
ncbi:DUF1446 domain-containing protein, partial [Nostoc sp. 3335mG]